ncbi:MAG: Nucleotidyltransferase domain protein [Chloroflexi bacterium ADurb.Bin325]|nr:MAG: Nucleotidyltransferase domain protein [Chloroflexi bacterium ADurb.Bin325]
MNASLDLSREKLAAFCQRWRVSELSVFGSALRDDFRPDSDIDMLVAFLPDAAWTLLDHAQMQQELAAMFGRPVDLVTRPAVERSHNSIRRRAILSTAKPIYVAPVDIITRSITF